MFALLEGRVAGPELREMGGFRVGCRVTVAWYVLNTGMTVIMGKLKTAS